MTSPTVATDGVRGRPAQLASAHPQRGEHRLAEVVGEGHVRRRGDRLGDHLEPGVGVDPPALGPADRLDAVERVAAGVGEQVAQRASGLADRVVERHDALLEGDERRPRRQRFGQRRQAEG